jgi:hypothetical protein
MVDAAALRDLTEASVYEGIFPSLEPQILMDIFRVRSSQALCSNQLLHLLRYSLSSSPCTFSYRSSQPQAAYTFRP